MSAVEQTCSLYPPLPYNDPCRKWGTDLETLRKKICPQRHKIDPYDPKRHWTPLPDHKISGRIPDPSIDDQGSTYQDRLDACMAAMNNFNARNETADSLLQIALNQVSQLDTIVDYMEKELSIMERAGKNIA